MLRKGFYDIPDQHDDDIPVKPSQAASLTYTSVHCTMVFVSNKVSLKKGLVLQIFRPNF